MKIACFGDLHLSERSPRYAHTLEVLDRCLELALGHGATVFVFCGDVFEGDPSPDEYRAFLERVYPLTARGLVLIVRGNHESYDAYSFFSLLSPMIFVAWNDFCVLDIDGRGNFGGAVPGAIARILLVPYPVRYRPPFETIDQSAITNSLRESAGVIAEKVRACATPGLPLLVFGHVTIEGMTTRDMDFERHSPNEVVVPVAAFEPAALVKVGHIHRKQQLTAAIGGVGSLIRCSFSEASDPKIFGLITVQDDGTVIDGEIVSPCRGMSEFRCSLDDLVPSTVAAFEAAAGAGDEIKIVVGMDATDTARYDPTVFDPLRTIASHLVIEKDVRPVQRVRAPELTPNMSVVDEFVAWCRAAEIPVIDRMAGLTEKLREFD